MTPSPPKKNKKKRYQQLSRRNMFCQLPSFHFLPPWLPFPTPASHSSPERQRRPETCPPTPTHPSHPPSIHPLCVTRAWGSQAGGRIKIPQTGYEAYRRGYRMPTSDKRMCSINAAVARQRREGAGGGHGRLGRVLSDTGCPAGTSAPVNTSPFNPIVCSFSAEWPRGWVRLGTVAKKAGLKRERRQWCPPPPLGNIPQEWSVPVPAVPRVSYQHGELSAEQLRAKRLFLRLESDDSFFQTRFLSKAEDGRRGQAGRGRRRWLRGGRRLEGTMRTPLIRMDPRCSTRPPPWRRPTLTLDVCTSSKMDEGSDG